MQMPGGVPGGMVRVGIERDISIVEYFVSSVVGILNCKFLVGGIKYVTDLKFSIPIRSTISFKEAFCFMC